MKILFFSSYPLFSGSHKMALQLADFAREAGHEVLIGAPEDNLYLEKAKARGFKTHIYQAPESLLATGGQILKRSIFQKTATVLLDLLPYQFRVWTMLRRQKIDLVYIAQERGVIQIGPAARMAGTPVLWHVQGGLKDGAGFIHRIAALISTRIICVSNAVRDDLMTFVNADRKNSLLYNGIPDIEIANPKKTDEKTRILFAANITPHKGAHILIEAAALLKNINIHIDIAGWIQDQAYERYIVNLIEKHKLQSIVTLHGFVENIDDLYARADIIACPTVEYGTLHGQKIWWKEGFNLSALEAMRAAKPVVCSATYGLKEVVEHNVTGIHVDQNDAFELAHAIEHLAEMPETAEQLGLAGRGRYEVLFSEKHMRRNFNEVLQLF